MPRNQFSEIHWIQGSNTHLVMQVVKNQLLSVLSPGGILRTLSRTAGGSTRRSSPSRLCIICLPLFSPRQRCPSVAYHFVVKGNDCLSAFFLVSAKLIHRSMEYNGFVRSNVSTNPNPP